jgi:ketosteroid isomerase-like protein
LKLEKCAHSLEDITDGKEVKISTKRIELMKHQPDGTWKILINYAFGVFKNMGAKN